MKIMHFFPKSNGLNFLKRFQEHLEGNYNDGYQHFSKTDDFYEVLDTRINNTDIIVFTAHGEPTHIVGEQKLGRDVLLTLDDLGRCKHSFVFAFSCSTGDLGAEICRQHKAIAYLGFKDIIDLVVKTEGRAFSDDLRKILRKMYNDALCKSFNEFLGKNYNVDQFARTLSRNLEMVYAHILAMSPEELKVNFDISLKVATNSKFLWHLRTDLLTTIDGVRKRIVVHGESEFIPWLFIDTSDPDKLKNLIEKIEKCVYKDDYNNYYKYFLLWFLYNKLGLTEDANRYLRSSLVINLEYVKQNSFLDEYEIAELKQPG
ncbi:hypothetical protein J31TS6_59130 [Brevibacillus reuszeri]|uniref:hypothetical protein n=1 Tax=Brevibacillus reuszeri TaxID=54915 RepID=UPI001B1CEAB9|nr:hypothetical protein [Brevibacillus reuszeri]GIO09885.1 hypothetical protein J31TS6_59130 [Brevibacillus reuszeri]